jgi:hypothetical protein
VFNFSAVEYTDYRVELPFEGKLSLLLDSSGGAADAKLCEDAAVKRHSEQSEREEQRDAAIHISVIAGSERSERDPQSSVCLRDTNKTADPVDEAGVPAEVVPAKPTVSFTLPPLSAQYYLLI